MPTVTPTPQPGFMPTADMVNHPNPAIRASQVANLANLLRDIRFWIDQVVQTGEEGVGTVQSVAIVTPGEITVAGSPITTSGTFQLSWTSQLGSLVFSSPNGAPGTPGFRQLQHAELGGVTANQHHNEDHEARHVSGGADPFLSTDLLEAIVKRLKESGGPTTLLIGAIGDGEFLLRSGTSIIGGVQNKTFTVWTGSSIPQGETVSATTSWVDLPFEGGELIVRPGGTADWPSTATHHLDLMGIDSGGPGDVRVRMYDRATGNTIAEISSIPSGGATTRLTTQSFSNLPIPNTNASVVTLQIKRDAGPTADAIIGGWRWFYELP